MIGIIFSIVQKTIINEGKDVLEEIKMGSDSNMLAFLSKFRNILEIEIQ